MKQSEALLLLLFSMLERRESESRTHVVVVGTVCGLLHGGVLLVIPDLHTHHRVHVQSHQLPGFNHGDANLKGGVSMMTTIRDHEKNARNMLSLAKADIYDNAAITDIILKNIPWKS